MNEDHSLSTWGEIAKYLGVSIRTAQAYEKADGLPVHRRGASKRAPVWAYCDELDDWRRQQSNLTDVTPPALTPQSVSDQPTFEPHRSTPRRRLWVSAAIAASVTIAAAALIVSHGQSRTDRIPSGFVLKGSTLTMINSLGETLWNHTFADGILADAYPQPSRHPWLSIGDIDGDGIPEVIFAHKSKDFLSVGATVLCFSAKGELRWQFKPDRAVETSSRKFVPPYFVNNVQVVTAPDRLAGRVLVSSNHYLTYPDQVALLDANGRVLGEYWHVGHLQWLAQTDLEGDGHWNLLFGGVDNTRREATLVVLDQRKLSGLSRSSQTGPLQFANLPPPPPGLEKTRVWFPRSCFVKPEEHNQVASLRVTKDRIVVVVAEGPNINEYKGQVIYELDHHMNVLSVMTDISFRENSHELLTDNLRSLPNCLSQPEDFKRAVVVVHNPS